MSMMGTKHSPLQEPQVILTTEPLLQTQNIIFIWFSIEIAQQLIWIFEFLQNQKTAFKYTEM